MKRISAVLLTSLLTLGAFAAQAADAPAASTAMKQQQNNVGAQQRNINKQNNDIKAADKNLNTENRDRDNDIAKLKKDEKAGNAKAVAADKKAITQANKDISKDKQKDKAADKAIGGDRNAISGDQKRIKNDKAAAASTAPAASTH